MLFRIKVFAVLLLFLHTFGANAEINLVFGTYASDKPTAMVRKLRPILNRLQQKMTSHSGEKVQIKLHIARDYESGVEDIKQGIVDIARLGPASYIEVKEAVPEVSLLAMENKKGSKRFKGVIAVSSNSKITSVEDLKGKSFAFGNQRSTIGRYLSQAYLAEHGVYASDLSRFDYLGRHDKVGYAVARGLYEAGALKESTYKKLVSKGVGLKKLVSFENVTKPWVARKGLDKKLLVALKESLISITDKEVLKPIKKDGFLEAEDSEYDFIRQAIKTNKNFFR